MFASRNVSGGVYDDREAFIHEATEVLGRRDAKEAAAPELLTPQWSPAVVIEEIGAEDDDSLRKATEAALEHAQVAAQSQLNFDSRVATETSALVAVKSTAEHDLALDHTEDAVKQTLLQHTATSGSLLIEGGRSSKLKHELVFAASSSVGDGSHQKPSMQQLALAYDKGLTDVVPTAWIMPEQDGDFKEETRQYHEDRMQRRDVLFASSLPQKDAAVDSQPCTDAAGCITNGGAAAQEPAPAAVCVFCASDLRRTPGFRLRLRAGKDLLEYLARDRVLHILSLFCDECVVHYMDAMLTTDWDDPQAQTSLLDQIKILSK